MNEVEKGFAYQDMASTDGYKALLQYITDRETQYREQLVNKKFQFLSEVNAIQERLKVYAEIKGEVDSSIKKAIQQANKG